MSDKIKSQHISRKAILYVRQSSTYQVINNTESRRLQYAMRQRSLEARYAKARRGELVIAVCTGFVKTSDQRIEKEIKLPRRNQRGELSWRTPRTSSILNILQNPCYAGTTTKATSLGKTSNASR